MEDVVLGYHEKRDYCPILTQLCYSWIPNLDFLFHENLFVDLDLFKEKWYDLATSCKLFYIMIPTLTCNFSINSYINLP